MWYVHRGITDKWPHRFKGPLRAWSAHLHDFHPWCTNACAPRTFLKYFVHVSKFFSCGIPEVYTWYLWDNILKFHTCYEFFAMKSTLFSRDSHNSFTGGAIYEQIFCNLEIAYLETIFQSFVFKSTLQILQGFQIHFYFSWHQVNHWENGTGLSSLKVLTAPSRIFKSKNLPCYGDEN